MTARAFLATFALLVSVPAFAHKYVDPGDPATGAMVLCYHIVESPQDPRMEIGRDAFRQQMQYLEMTGYNVIPLRQLYEFVAGKRTTLPPNAVVITIDDGWRSTFTEVYPELKKRAFPFTVFVYPQIIGKTATALKWDQVREMSDNGGDIESHSLSHPYLTRRRHADQDDAAYAKWLQRELVDSKRLVEKHTGHAVEFFAYPYGDYDHYLAAAVGRAGYSAALTCDFGKVVRGSNPLKMKRFVIDKGMDFADFRHYLGASPMELAEMTPKPGDVFEPATEVISAKIPNFKSLEPHSVGMALLSASSLVPYAYDPDTGSITLMVNDAINILKGKYHRAVVWATDSKTGRRVEATWTFKLPEDEPEPLPIPQPAATPAQAAPAAPHPAIGMQQTSAVEVIPVSGAAIVTAHSPR
jgi:peptidoglycan/xylan/chitin deacetylase (PgdA/CDA1 family)